MHLGCTKWDLKKVVVVPCLTLLLNGGLFGFQKLAMRALFSTINSILKCFLTQQDWRKHGFQSFYCDVITTINFLNVSKVSVRYFFFVKTIQFLLLTAKLIQSRSSTAIIWFFSFIALFSLLFSNRFLQLIFHPRKFWKMLVVGYQLQRRFHFMPHNNGCLKIGVRYIAVP